MLAHKNICVFLDWPHFRLTDAVQHGLTVYTGPIDEFFGHCFGRLPYRSLNFLHRNSSITQKAPTIVYPEEDVSFTRITDWRQIPGNHKDSDTTSILVESPAEGGEPMYPVPAAESSALYVKYEELAKSRKDILFAGRLGTYKYYNMDQVVKDTLERVKPWL
jgi:UDP-galactopyranose mutase